MSDPINFSFLIGSIKKLHPSNITDKMIIVDIRKRADFDFAHFRGAVSLNIPNILWKRLETRKCNKSEFFDDILMMSTETRIIKNRHTGTMIVLYDENTCVDNLSDNLSDNSVLRVLCDIFATENETKFAIVDGGFCAINAERQDMIVVPPISSFKLINTQLQNSPVQRTDSQLSFFLDFMTIGSIYEGSNIALLDSVQITHVLNITTTDCSDKVKNGRITMQIPILDTHTQDILYYFPAAFEFIQKARDTPNARLLLYCHAGISRSPSFAIAYIMWAECKSFYDAFTFVHEYRGIISPNLHFTGQLITFGKFLSSTATERCSPSTAVADATKYLHIMYN